MLRENDLIAEFERFGALTKGHFVLADFDHTDTYFDKRMVSAHTELWSRICLEFALKFQEEDIDLVLGPASGATSLAYETARWLNFLQMTRNKRIVLAAYADKSGSDFVLKGGFPGLVKGARVLIVEDVLTSGKSVAKLVKMIEACGGIVVGVCAVWNRNKVTAVTLGVKKLYALIKKRIPSWPEKKCGLCKKQMPVYVLLGHGEEYLKRRDLEKLKDSYKRQ